jgi:predicted RNA-binding protein with PUA domain
MTPGEAAALVAPTASSGRYGPLDGIRLTSPADRRMAADRRIDCERLFFPNAGQTGA